MKNRVPWGHLIYINRIWTSRGHEHILRSLGYLMAYPVLSVTMINESWANSCSVYKTQTCLQYDGLTGEKKGTRAPGFQTSVHCLFQRPLSHKVVFIHCTEICVFTAWGLNISSTNAKLGVLKIDLNQDLLMAKHFSYKHTERYQSEERDTMSEISN